MGAFWFEIPEIFFNEWNSILRNFVGKSCIVPKYRFSVLFDFTIRGSGRMVRTWEIQQFPDFV